MDPIATASCSGAPVRPEQGEATGVGLEGPPSDEARPHLGFCLDLGLGFTPWWGEAIFSLFFFLFWKASGKQSYIGVDPMKVLRKKRDVSFVGGRSDCLALGRILQLKHHTVPLQWGPEDYRASNGRTTPVCQVGAF